MTREFKFRAWDKEKKKMSAPFTFNDLYGYEGECNAVNVEPEGSDEIFNLVEHDSGARDGAMMFMYPQFETVNGINQNLEILQFTGLKDKNGKEIYEGDIVDTPKGKRKVFWHVDSFCIDYFDATERSYLSLCWWGTPELEVIGDIYQNPELLDEKEK